MLKHSMLILMAVSAMAAAGCGQSGPSQPDPDPVGSNVDTSPTYNGPPGNYGPGPQPGMPQTGGQAVQQLQQAWGAVRTVSATYDLFEKGTKGTETANVKFYYRKPGDYRYEVSRHTSSIKNGSKSVFNTRTRQIESRLGGVASFLPIKGTLDDERSKSIRDYTLDQTDYATQTELFLAPGAQVSQRAPGVLELARPLKYPGCETLRVTLDPQRGLPVSFELVERGQVVYRKRITGLVVNPSLGSDKFKL
jgi:outer membrane lipoprotein-sorting protein/predicted small lipoprotein YifL